MFRLKTLYRGLDLGKCLSIKVRKHFPTLVLTFWLYGGLNQVSDLSWPILAVIGFWRSFSVGQIKYLVQVYVSSKHEGNWENLRYFREFSQPKVFRLGKIFQSIPNEASRSVGTLLRRAGWMELAAQFTSLSASLAQSGTNS